MSPIIINTIVAILNFILHIFMFMHSKNIDLILHNYNFRINFMLQVIRVLVKLGDLSLLHTNIILEI